MRTTRLCRAVWLLKPCVSLSTDGTSSTSRREAFFISSSTVFSIGIPPFWFYYLFHYNIKSGFCHFFILQAKPSGLLRGRSPLRHKSDLATQGELPRRGKRRPPGGSAANPQKALAKQGFPCIRCCPRRRRKQRMKKTRVNGMSHLLENLLPYLYHEHGRH